MNSAAARTNAARETGRARMRRIVAEDDDRGCYDCGAPNPVVTQTWGGKIHRQCLICGSTTISADASRMTADELLDHIDALRA